MDKFLARIAFIACMVATIGDFAMTFFLGNRYPGYSQLRDSMSLLGSVSSPVSYAVSVWWIALCVLMLIFAFGFWKTFPKSDTRINTAAILIVIYALGEGLGSAVFPLNHRNQILTLTGEMHIAVGSAGSLAILFLPLILKNLFKDHEHPYFDKFSLIIFLAGTVFIALFLSHRVLNENNPVSVYQGLWQRLFVLDGYIFLMVLAFRMLKTRAPAGQY